MSVQKVKSLTYPVYEFIQQSCGKVTKMNLFCHKMRHIKTINTKIFCESLNHFMLRIRDSFYGNPTRNKKFRDKWLSVKAGMRNRGTE